MTKYQLLLDRINEVQDLRKAIRILTWDREVNMPPGGELDRTNQITTLNRLSHSLYTSDETGKLIEYADKELNGIDYASTEASLIRFLKQDYQQARLLPDEYIARSTLINGRATAAWKEARQKDDYSIFSPWLKEVIELAREKSEYIGFQDDPYDALLNVYEPGAKTSDIRALFEAAKRDLIHLYRLVRERKATIDDRFLHQHYPVKLQKEYSRYIASTIGYDFNRGHLATAIHPFSTSLSRNDVRITTRYNSEYLSPSIFATLHEAGHALYVQNVDPGLTRTPLAMETSAGLDESQSRLMENIVGRSLGFWKAQLPKLRKYFPAQLSEVGFEQFYKAINKVQPSLIRVEADELTYNMHVILRFEIEQALLNQSLAVQDVPQAWNERMKKFLGIEPPDFRQGCLQDIHWTLVGFGYFPTYALGNLYAAQFFEAACSHDPVILDELEEGKIDRLLEWLRANIHQHGRKFTAEEIVHQVTGGPLSHEAFVRYATTKFAKVYGL